MKNLIIFLSFFLFVGCGRVAIKNTTKCVIAGVWRAGLDCSTTLSSQTSEMNFTQMISWLEPQPERPDPDHPGKKLPARAGAFCESSDDQIAEKTALEQACSLLKNACTPEIKQAIQTAGANIDSLVRKSKGIGPERAQVPMLQSLALPVPEKEEEDPSRDDPPLEVEFLR